MIQNFRRIKEIINQKCDLFFYLYKQKFDVLKLKKEKKGR